ncbi:MAG: chemotaxis protein CheW [Desulfovibrio sp.]|uniref:chemotaxis protein CheW n=1 Tax=Desulfovibrio sp. 7SRBS1 TaxID=3378064 RepID=UPI003B3D50EB
MTSNLNASKTDDDLNKERNNDLSQYLTFILDGEIFAFSVETVREVVEVPPITRIPQVQEHMRGVINLRGTAVPVMDLRRKFGMDVCDITINSCIIIVSAGDDGEAMGALVDSVCEVVEISASSVEPPPRMGTTVNNQFMRGMVQVGENFFILLDVERIFTQGNGEVAIESDLTAMEAMAGDA